MKNKIKKLLLFVIFITLLSGLLLYKMVVVMSIMVIPTFWVIYGIFATIFLISRIPYAYLHKDDHSKVYPDSSYPNISIVIAAKNEEEGIFRTIATCVESKYKGKIECIVIDDGSTDNTKKEVIKAERFYIDKVKLIVFPKNQGKREAMAAGINEAKYEIIVFVDSDSFIAPDAIKHIVGHFLADKNVGAVSGNTKVENINKNTLTRMQSILYSISFDIYKAAESVHDSVTCCPGCFSAYRKEIIKPLVPRWKERKFLGSKSTFGDDRGLTNFVLQGWDIIYCEKAKATTTVPEKFKVYWKQQLRWKKSWIREGVYAGTFMWKDRHLFASMAFYINFSFPIIGPILALIIFIKSIKNHNPVLFISFVFGFVLLGLIFAFFVHIYRGAKYWYYMPLVSLLYFSVFIWQMPYALLTIRKNHWGTR